jgi:hypothetical protein
MSHNDKIFVSIASIEDPALIKTINSCLNNAKKPENIVFGISLQYEKNPDLNFISNQSRIIQHPFPDYDNNVGVGVVEIRNNIKKLHKDEEYFLQIDAHTKFKKNWDDILIHDINKFNKKTVISKQISEIENKNEHYSEFSLSITLPIVKASTKTNMNIIQDRLVDNNYFLNYFIAGGFIFTKSEWLYSVPVMPNQKALYEEETQSILTYCNGYQIVSPLLKRQVIFSDTDSKYIDKDEKWWTINKNNTEDKTLWTYTRKGIHETEGEKKELDHFVLFGKNNNIDITNGHFNIIDFYTAVGLGKEYRQLQAEIRDGAHSKDLWVVGYDSKEGMVGYRQRKLDPFFKGDE